MKTIIFILLTFFGFTFSNVNSQTAQTEKKTGIETITIKTNAKCEMCQKRISDAVYKLKGVKSVNVALENPSVTVQFKTGKTNGNAIKAAISNAGYRADDLEPNAEAKAKLPGCCK